jgi:putative protease
MPEQEVGTVTHYFDRPQVAVVKLTAGEVVVGDTLRFHGHTTEFTESVASMEVDHQKVERARSGDEIAIQVVGRARRHDRVLKVTP